MPTQVYPSPATWVKFDRTRSGEVEIDKIGQFISGFRPDFTWPVSQFRAWFRTSTVHPYFGRELQQYTLADLGLAPIEIAPRTNEHGEVILPPTDDNAMQWYHAHDVAPLIQDPNDPYVPWDTSFIVKLQRAHNVFGCTPQEFREVHLAEYYKRLEEEAETLFAQDDQRLHDLDALYEKEFNDA